MGSHLDKPITEKENYESEAHGLKFGAAAMQGWRVEMEDAHTIIETIDPELDGHSFIAVYDGHGGQYSAIYCGEHMISFLKKTKGFEDYKKTKDVTHLQSAIHAAFLDLDEVLKRQDEFVHKQDTSGCTAICAIITPTHVVVGNAGDSRGVIYSSDGAKQLSRDHKPYLDDERKRIEEAGGMVSMQRVDGDLALSRSIGDFQYKDRHLPPERQKVTAVPEVEIHERHHEKDEILLLACDGVWDVCENEEAGQILKEVLMDGEKRMALIAEELLDQCLLRYSKDNISAVVVGFEKMSRHEKEGEGVEGRRRKRQEQQEGGGGGGRGGAGGGKVVGGGRTDSEEGGEDK